MSDFNFEIKNLAKQSLIYGISSVIGRLLSLISAPILTRIFNINLICPDKMTFLWGRLII